MVFEDIVKAAISGVMDDEREVRLVPLDFWNESVFRFLFVRELLRGQYPGLQCQSEWRRIDLVVTTTEEAHFVEIKFFLHHISRSLDGRRQWQKRGPLPRDDEEFSACVKKLASLKDEDWRKGGTLKGRRWIVLVYADPTEDWTKATNRYSKLFDNLSHEKIKTVSRSCFSVPKNNLTVVLLEVIPTQSLAP